VEDWIEAGWVVDELNGFDCALGRLLLSMLRGCLVSGKRWVDTMSDAKPCESALESRWVISVWLMEMKLVLDSDRDVILSFWSDTAFTGWSVQ
jgi:hypothetical protein